MEKSVIELIDDYSGSQKVLIDELNKKLIGWANYHRIAEATTAFRHIDNTVKARLLELCENLHPKTKRKKLIERFFYKESDGEYVYALEHKPDVRVHRIAKTVLVVHQPVAVTKNPYIDFEYYEKRNEHKAIASVTGRYKKIWQRQDGKCFYCGGAILADERRDVVVVNPEKREFVQNLAYVHEYCKTGQAEFYTSDYEISSQYDLYELLKGLSVNENRLRKYRYRPLFEHFRLHSEPVFTLTFMEIGKIIGYGLCNSAYEHSSFWLTRSESAINLCWEMNGYKIRKLHLDKEKIVFERCEDMGTSPQIPAFMYKSMPPNARAEVDIFFKYIKGKYGL